MMGSVRLLPTLRAAWNFVAPLGLLEAAPCLRHTLAVSRNTESSTRVSVHRMSPMFPLLCCSFFSDLQWGPTVTQQYFSLHAPKKTLFLLRPKNQTCDFSVCRSSRVP